MKKISIISLSAIALLIVIAGCVKNVIDYGDIQKLDTSTQALLKFNYVSNYANNRSVFFKINDQRISGLITARTPFPGGGFNTGGGNTADFMQVTAGSTKLSVIMPRKVDNGTDSLELYSTTVQLVAGKYYTINITDTAATTKSLLTEENFTRPDSTFSRFHFINLMPNVPAVDLYYGSAAITAVDQSTDSLIVSNVAYMQNTPDFFIKYTGTNKIWKVRPAGAVKNAATLLSTYTSTSVPLNQRVYLAMALGYQGKTTTAQKPYVSFVYIR